MANCAMCGIVVPNVDVDCERYLFVCVPCGDVVFRHLNPKWEVCLSDRCYGRVLYSPTSDLDKAVKELLQRRQEGHCPQCGNKHAI
jgi:hypothetical protein